MIVIKVNIVVMIILFLHQSIQPIIINFITISRVTNESDLILATCRSRLILLFLPELILRTLKTHFKVDRPKSTNL